MKKFLGILVLGATLLINSPVTAETEISPTKHKELIKTYFSIALTAFEHKQISYGCENLLEINTPMSEANIAKLEISKKAWNEAHKKQYALDQKQKNLQWEITNLQWNSDKLSRDLVSAKTSALTAKNKMNTATQNAAVVGVSIERISEVASLAAEETSAKAAEAAKQVAQQASENCKMFLPILYQAFTKSSKVFNLDLVMIKT